MENLIDSLILNYISMILDQRLKSYMVWLKYKEELNLFN